jgi:tRNA (cytidine/uridine-2'-O-)-methyltransferase
MFSVVLYQPEIPPNTGNIMRLCANTGCALHLIRPLGFDLDERSLRRAGLDYRDYAQVSVHDSLDAVVGSNQRAFAVSTRGTTRPDQVAFRSGDAFLFGPETRGLPQEVLDALPEERRLRIPMVANSRSLNLSNAVAVVVYEAWRQQHFENGY